MKFEVRQPCHARESHSVKRQIKVSGNSPMCPETGGKKSGEFLPIAIHLQTRSGAAPGPVHNQKYLPPPTPGGATRNQAAIERNELNRKATSPGKTPPPSPPARKREGSALKRVGRPGGSNQAGTKSANRWRLDGIQHGNKKVAARSKTYPP